MQHLMNIISIIIKNADYHTKSNFFGGAYAYIGIGTMYSQTVSRTTIVGNEQNNKNKTDDGKQCGP